MLVRKHSVQWVGGDPGWAGVVCVYSQSWAPSYTEVHGSWSFLQLLWLALCQTSYYALSFSGAAYFTVHSQETRRRIAQSI